jgi:PadR family transcriptional regulator PadR
MVTGVSVPRTPSEMLSGTVDVLILRALAGRALHGYAISGWVRERSGDRLFIEGAALYQALHRLERQRLVSGEWGLSEHNRRARYYELTSTGRERLRAESANWRRYAEAVATVLGP